MAESETDWSDLQVETNEISPVVRELAVEIESARVDAAYVNVIKELRKYYKMIIIDGPPILPVSDALRMAQIVDGVILVVQAGKTRMDITKRAIELLKEARCNLLGVVLNDVKEVLPYYYHNKNYFYNYEKIKSK